MHNLSLAAWLFYLPLLEWLLLLFFSAYTSLQCLTSTHLRGQKWHLFGLTFSVVLWRGRDTANKHYWHVWGALTVDGQHRIFVFVFSVILSSEIPMFPTDPAYERISYCVETSPPSRLPPQDGSPSLNALFLFSSLSSVLSHLKEIGLPFWVSRVLHQHCEVVLWRLLHMQMIFWCVGGG